MNYSLLLENLALEKRLESHYDFNEQNHHIDRIRNYTDGDSYDMNSHLWSEENDEYRQKEVNKMNKTLHYHKTPEAFTVYSGTGHHPRRQVCLI